MTNRNLRRWIWLPLMVFATAWYAWPQFAYSLVPAYDLLSFLFPDLTAGLQPWVETIRSKVGR
jgi:hypothetical protein